MCKYDENGKCTEHGRCDRCGECGECEYNEEEFDAEQEKLNATQTNIDKMQVDINTARKTNAFYAGKEFMNKGIVIMQAWNVYLNGKLINTVFYGVNCDKDYVLDGLINHDGMNPAIIIRRSN